MDSDRHSEAVMARVVHFEIFSPDAERVVPFYESIFGWKSRRYGEYPYWLTYTGEGPGIDGAISAPVEGMPPVVNTIDVESVDDRINAVLDAGGTIVRPKMAVDGIGWLVYCADPGGNVFGMIEADPAAKTAR
jgi:predicted enzyme related to lactoylglutathione lyase